MSQESDGGFFALSPEFEFSEVERIPELDKRVEVLGKSFQVSLGLLDGSGSTRALSGRSECRSRSDEGGENSGLHCQIRI